MNKCKKLLAAVAALTLCLSMGLSVFAAARAYEIPEVALTLNIPEGSYLFTSATPDADPSWKAAGNLDPVKHKTEYKDMGVLLHLSANQGKTNVYVSKKETDTTKAYYSIASMSPEERTKFIGPYNTSEEGGMSSVAEFYEHPQTPFLKVQIDAAPMQEDQKPIQEAVYFTIINGYTVSFSTYAEEKLPPESLAYVKELVDSVNFTNIIPKPQASQQEIQQGFLYLALLLGVVALLIALFVISRIRRKQRKNATKQLAERLSVYRKEKALQTSGHGEPLYENTTVHSDEAVKQFSIFQAYLRKPLMPIFTLGVTIGGTFFSIWAHSEWWISLLIAAAAVFCIYKFATASTYMSKALRKVYGKLKSKNAKYCFYEKEFTISGMQSAEEYPYFQISEIEEYRGTVYIYFGENNTYYVDKKTFSKGDPATFKAFLKAKMTEK